jgi:hypothetical protein
MSITLTGNTITNTGTALTEKVGTSVTSKTIDSSGYVLLRNKPAFMTSPQRSNGASPNGVWAGNSSVYNTTNSGMNMTTGRFTAPIAGTYVFDMVGISEGGALDIRYALMKNGNTNTAHCITQSTTGNHGPTNVSVVWRLAVGDYVEPIVYSGAGTHGAGWGYFSGYFVG